MASPTSLTTAIAALVALEHSRQHRRIEPRPVTEGWFGVPASDALDSGATPIPGIF